MKPMAMAVARRVWGVALFASQVQSVGARMYVPGIEKKREPYWTLCFVEPVYPRMDE
jgi:hypothetical protein